MLVLILAAAVAAAAAVVLVVVEAKLYWLPAPQSLFRYVWIGYDGYVRRFLISHEGATAWVDGQT